MMKNQRLIQCIDTHSAGEPTRVVLGGMPKMRGSSMKEKYDYIQENYDHIRTALFQEPRGFSNLLGCIVTEPVNDEADVGAIFTSATDYFEMCGDSTFSLSKTLVETGMVDSEEPVTNIKLDTYGGIVDVSVQVSDGVAGEITYKSVPAFYSDTKKIEIEPFGELTAELSFGGMWYAFIPVKDVGLDQISTDHMKQVLESGMSILNKINDKVNVSHPSDPNLDQIQLITFYEKDPAPGVSYKIANVYGDDATCRSPAGTMTAARTAASYAKGEISLNEEMVIENGWIGSQHRVTVVEETNIDNQEAIIPELTATAYITGTHQVMMDEEDPYKDGFLLQ